MSHWTFDTEEMRKIIQGKYKLFPCLECGTKGTELVDGVAGVVVQSIHPERDPIDYYTMGCVECNGLGYFIHLT